MRYVVTLHSHLFELAELAEMYSNNIISQQDVVTEHCNSGNSTIH